MTQMLEDIFKAHQGKVSDKWSSYLPFYQRNLSPYQNSPIRLLEIGVQNGGSLEIWSKFFPNAKAIVGCDINPKCGDLIYEDQRVHLFVGDAGTDDVKAAIEEISTQFDIIIDDGSHQSDDIIKAFAQYFPMLEPGGTYIVEDLHASYFEDLLGGTEAPFSSINFFKRLADYVNKEHWGADIPANSLLSYFSEKWCVFFDPDCLNDITEVSFSNSLVLIRKGNAGDNALGERLIAGTSALVVDNVAKLNKSKPQKRDETRNPRGPLGMRLEEIASENVHFYDALQSMVEKNFATNNELSYLKEEAAELKSALREPLKHLGRKMQYKILSSLSKSRIIVPERTAARFAKSAAKRRPSLLKAMSERKQEVPDKDAKLLRDIALTAFITARSVGYELAVPSFKKLDSAIESVGARDYTLRSLLSDILDEEPSRHGPVALPRIERNYCDLQNDVVIYTAIFGHCDRLPPICTQDHGLEFVCFTDQEIKAPGWTIEHREPMFPDSNLSAKYFKLNPHIVFPDRKFSLFVDGNTLFLGRVRSFIDRWLSNQDFALWRHPDRDCVFNEAEAIILSGKAPAAEVAQQMGVYEKRGTPSKQGAYECSFIWRRHMDPSIRAFNEAWWQEVTTYTKRDQLSFYHLAHTQGPKPVVLPDDLGTSRENIYFSKVPHVSIKHKPVFKPRHKPLVTFLYDKKYEQEGSTVMRSIQLPAFLQRELDDRVEIRMTTDMEAVRDSLVIVGKRMIQTTSPEALRGLRTRNVALAADPVDSVFAGDKVNEFDFMIAASLKALQNHTNASAKIDRYLITHHADPRIAPMTVPGDRFRMGYFGQPSNTIGHGHIEHLVDYHLVDTAKADHSWLERLGDYNAHFALRKERDFDGFKPFTKGFIAARCGAVVLCGRGEGDSSYYLGDDYPFYLDDRSPEALKNAIVQMATIFKGQEWQYACEIMEEVRHRSSEAWIAKEFSHIINDIWQI